MKVIKRDGRTVTFNQDKITQAIFKAAQAVGGNNLARAQFLSNEVTRLISQENVKQISVEEIQDIVEKTLIENGHAKTAKAYILYRQKRKEVRDFQNLMLNAGKMIQQYLGKGDWRIKENSNMDFSLQGLNNHIITAASSKYWLEQVYPSEIRQAHKLGDFHIHDLGLLAPYCCGWDLPDLLIEGFGGAPQKIESSPAKHFRTALGQIVNFFYTLQGEAAGAQALGSIDTYLAPFVRYDQLAYKEVKQAMQEFIFNLNVPTRVGFQTPFVNLTFDITVPSFMKNEPVIFGGQRMFNDPPYGDYQKEMDMINLAFCEIMTTGDAKGRIFTFPIPTYNITKDFPWESPVAQKIMAMTAKYGVPYFANFVNSNMKPEDVRSMCCRLRLDTRELQYRGGGLFGANPLTGSIGVVTLNLPRIGYKAKSFAEFLSRIAKLATLAKQSLLIKRKTLEQLTEMGLYPYSQFYLRNVKAGTGSYWSNHFNTIGIVGMNEALINLTGVTIATKQGQDLALKTLEHIRTLLIEYQEETGQMFNLEATPAESTNYKLARLDKELYPNIITAGNNEPYYTNSTQLPVNATDDVFTALDLQDNLQTKYTGGTVFHAYLGEQVDNPRIAGKLIQTVFSHYKLPYFSLTPTFSICSEHGYLNGEQPMCPYCKQETEVWSRVVGYYRPVKNWNKGKQEEFKQRTAFR